MSFSLVYNNKLKLNNLLSMQNEFNGAYFHVKQEIMEAYLFLRKNNMTVSSETIEFMKDAAIEKLDNALDNNETKTI